MSLADSSLPNSSVSRFSRWLPDTRRTRSVVCTGVAMWLLAIAAPVFLRGAEALSGTDYQVRTVLNFKVADAAVQKLLPAGWELNSPTTGATKGFNLGVSLISQTESSDEKGKSLPPRTYVALNVPAKKTGGTETGIMVFGGFTSPELAPGAYGNYVGAQVTVDRRVRMAADGKTMVDESWAAKAADGSTLEVQVQYVSGQPVRSKQEAKVYSATKLGFYRIYRFEQTADVVRSTATGIDHVAKFSCRGSGPLLGTLFDGKEQLIAVTSVPNYSRAVFLPVP